MTTVPPSPGAILGAIEPQKADAAARDARELQRKLVSAFAPISRDKAEKHSAIEELREGLKEGRYGGLNLECDAAHALLSLLHALEWPVVPERFAQAMPHFPVTFGIVEIREVLARLGMNSSVKSLTSAQISEHHLPALVEGPDGDLNLLRTSENGTIIAIAPASGERVPFSWTKPIPVYSFDKPSLTPEEKTTPKSWIMETVRRFRPEILLLFGLTFAINLMVLVVSFAVMAIYDKVIPAQAYDTLAAIVIGIGLAFCFELSFRRLKATIIGHISGRLEYLLGQAIFSKLINLPLEMMTSVPIGSQLSRLRQFEVIRDLFAGPFVAVGLEIPFMFMFIAALFMVGGVLGFVPIVLIVIYAIIGCFMIPIVKRHSDAAMKSRMEQYQTLLDTVSNLRLIRSYGCEDAWLERLTKKTDEMAIAKRKANLSKRILSTMSAAAVPISGGSMVLIGAVLVINGDLTTGVLIGATILVWRVLAPIQQAFLMLTNYSEMAQVIMQVDRMMKLPRNDADDVPLVRKFNGTIRFDRVSFRYPNMSDAALAGLSAEIEAGSFIALVGPSGAGKSSLLRMVLGIYRPQSGTVSIDGVNIRQMPPREYRSVIGYVPQTPIMFHGTIAQNLRLAAPNASDAALRTVCEEMGIWNAIESLPKGLNTLLDHARQESLPSGFRQALSVAQALVRKPKILLLDEPAKNFDFQIERAFIETLQRRRGDTTIIMISHRPSHIKLADKVMSLERGQLASFDPPEQPPISAQAG